MASTKAWALLTQSLFISMAGATRVSSEVETSLRKEAAEKMYGIFKDNENAICGGTEIHDLLAKASTGSDMRTTNWDVLLRIADVYLGTVGLEKAKEEKCQADRAALEAFKKELEELNKEIADAFRKAQDLASELDEAQDALTSNEDSAAAEQNVNTIEGNYNTAQDAYTAALQAFTDTYKRGSNLGS